MPRTECLKDVVERLLPYWYDAIVPDLRLGRTVLVAAHGNSLRALVKHLDGLSDEAVVELNIPTGIPLRYELDAATLQPTGAGEYLDPDAAAAPSRRSRTRARSSEPGDASTARLGRHGENPKDARLPASGADSAHGRAPALGIPTAPCRVARSVEAVPGSVRTGALPGRVSVRTGRRRIAGLSPSARTQFEP